MISSDRKRCSYIYPETLKQCKSMMLMVNGRCRFHGGESYKKMTGINEYTDTTRKKVNELKANLGVEGQTLAKIVSRIEDDPYYKDMSYEINLLAGLIEYTQIQLQKVSPKDPEYNMLNMAMIKLVRERSQARERFAKISATFIDIVALKMLISQISQVFERMRLSVRSELEHDERLMEKMLRILDRHVNELDQVKLPLSGTGRKGR